MIILAIDPGYERLGVAVLEKTKGKKENLLFSTCIRTNPKDVFEDRLLELGSQIELIIQEYKPTILSIENLFISNNQKTAMRVAEVRGMLIYISRKNNLQINEFTPLQIKLSITGSGKSEKNQVIKMVKLLIGNKNKISTPSNNKNILDDEYDAIAIGLTYFAYNHI